MLNNRIIIKVLPSIIHWNQTGFIQNRNLKTNVRTCISLTQCAKREKVDLTLMAVDAEKAFDCLEWSYLYEVLGAYSFPQEITKLIQTIYKLPTANVY